MLPPGHLIGDWVVDGAIGAGGTAIVYKVHHARESTVCALKVLTVTSAAIRARVQREAVAQSTLNHPNVVVVHELLDVAGNPALRMELVVGPTLEEALAAGRFPLAEAERVFVGVVEGVKAAHALGIVHRDLKPANVILAERPGGQSVPKVADFGIAKIVDDAQPEGHTRAGVAMGTPQYMAPEQIRDASKVDHRADIFSLGCLLYELVTGRRAFPQEDIIAVYNAVCDGTWALPESWAPDLPDRLTAAIGGCLCVDRDRRIPDCATLLAVFRGQLPWIDFAISDAETTTPLALLDAPPLRATAALAAPANTAPHRPTGDGQAVISLLDPDDLGPTDLLTEAVDRATAEAQAAEAPIADVAPSSPASPDVAPAPEGPGWVVAATAVIAALLAFGWWVAAPAPPRTAPAPQPTVAAAPPAPAPAAAPVTSVGPRPGKPAVPGPIAPVKPATPAAPLAPAAAASTAPTPAQAAAPPPPTPAAAPVTKLLSDPPTANVSVDGRSAGRTPAKLTLEPGPHQVVLTSGSQRSSFTIDVTAGGSNKWCHVFGTGQTVDGACP